MSSFFAIPTLLGQAAIAAAVAGTAPLDLTTIVVGDGGGNATNPIETQVALVHQVGSFVIQAVSRAANVVTIDTVIDENSGGWTIREAGILDNAGNLLFVCSVPDTYKGTIADGVDDVLTLGMNVVISDTAQITIVASPNSYVTQDYVTTNYTNTTDLNAQFVAKTAAPLLFYGTM